MLQYNTKKNILCKVNRGKDVKRFLCLFCTNLTLQVCGLHNDPFKQLRAFIYSSKFNNTHLFQAKPNPQEAAVLLVNILQYLCCTAHNRF